MPTKTAKPAAEKCVRDDCDRPGTQLYTFTERRALLQGGDATVHGEYLLCARCAASPYRVATARAHALRAAARKAGTTA